MNLKSKNARAGFRNRLSCALGAFVLLAVCSQSAWADSVTYTYQGDSFTQFLGSYACSGGVGECNISGSFTVDAPLGANFAEQLITPVSFSFTDGVNTWTNTNSTDTEFLIATDASGNISFWDVTAQFGPSTDYYDFETVYGAPVSLDETSECFDPGGCANTASLNMNPSRSPSPNIPMPGTWTETATTVPEPGVIFLLIAGLVAVGFMARHRKPAGRAVAAEI
jgi:hypothetical protein